MSDEIQSNPSAEKLRGCEAALGYEFSDRELLERCLTHASVARTRLTSNERLEFLGDAILGAIVCEMLYHRFPQESEGELTRMKSVLVSRNTCAEISEQKGLSQFLFLGKGLESNGNVPMSISAAVFESLIAGVYFDGGPDAARDLVVRLLEDELEKSIEVEHGKNYKSLLQQLSQKTHGETPIYRLLDEKGPDHSKCFQVAAIIGEHTHTAAWGNSKKQAEQQAAHHALRELQGLEIPESTD
jgi:ribonuclease-3